MGQRMGSNVPKQFLKVYGKEIIIHTIEKFEHNDQIDKIYVGLKFKIGDLKMKIVIIGLGKIGRTILENLATEEHTLTIIDENKDKVESLIEKYDVLVLLVMEHLWTFKLKRM